MKTLSSSYSPNVKIIFEDINASEDVHENPLAAAVFKFAAATREHVQVNGGQNEIRPTVASLNINTNSSLPEVTIAAWSSDWAFTNALQRVARDNPGHPALLLPPFGGPIGVAVILFCNEGVVLTKRSMNVAVSPGKLASSVTEGINDKDLVRAEGGVYIDGRRSAQRGLMEEVGLNIPCEDIQPTVFFDFADGYGYALVFMVETSLSFAEILKAHAGAEDRGEGNLTLFAPEGAVEAAAGSNVGIGTPVFLAAALALHANTR